MCKHAPEYTKSYGAHGFDFEVLDLSDVTFRPGTDESVHSWFRLTPSYSPELVRFFLKYLECDPERVICDPFSGKGTTSIECQKQSFQAIAVEINPLLAKVSNWALKWDYELTSLDTDFKKIRESFEKYHERSKSMKLEAFLDHFQLQLPLIHNPLRWWRECVLRELLLLRKLCSEKVTPDNSPFFSLLMSEACLRCANIHRNHPTITFDDNHDRTIDVWQEFEDRFTKMRSDLKMLDKHSNGCFVIEGDSTRLSQTLGETEVHRVITSPPYPNRFSYIHQTRPQLFFMELIETAKEATEIDLAAIGGTWGRATSVLEKEFIPPNPGTEGILDYVPELRKNSLLMCNYATKYFNMMHAHIRELKKTAAKGFKGVYVVGNSRLSGVEIVTEVILSKLFVLEGFNLDKIVVFRKRGGKKKLYETGVCVSL
ncbi:MAG: hypothetical protein DWQ47_16560 [Acidobacteria bacterium]|nr:MAG: hypothetical protein DWQ32_03960 [Acidobacteriota bacterium]REK03132.1 MAG: hypothetical protein DWQ38_08180 [Acidobacteriota bacterium]REK15413.1 MAG: hypothetical protein DWQ43_09650 [Acidobacteriota bacterium]REK42131.1 MAG: hypothetical protein DWQ47_16560 [Acidobacteriota bacterium]